jgi:hypothetical protein
MNKRIRSGYGYGVVFVANQLLAVATIGYGIIRYTTAQNHKADQNKKNSHGLIPLY